MVGFSTVEEANEATIMAVEEKGELCALDWDFYKDENGLPNIEIWVPDESDGTVDFVKSSGPMMARVLPIKGENGN